MAALDPTSILAVGHTTSGRGAVTATAAPATTEDDAVLHVISEHDFQPGLSSVVGNVVCYIAGFVVKKTLESTSCSTCQEALVSTVQPEDLSQLYHLLRLKDRGGLLIPSPGVVKVCLTSEEELRRRSALQDSALGCC